MTDTGSSAPYQAPPALTSVDSRAADSVADYVKYVVGPRASRRTVERALHDLAPVIDGDQIDAYTAELVRDVALAEVARQAGTLRRRLMRAARLRFGCATVPELLAARASGRISVPDTKTLYVHLDRCSACAELAGRFNAAEWQLHRSAPPDPVSAPARKPVGGRSPGPGLSFPGRAESPRSVAAYPAMPHLTSSSAAQPQDAEEQPTSPLALPDLRPAAARAETNGAGSPAAPAPALGASAVSFPWQPDPGLLDHPAETRPVRATGSTFGGAKRGGRIAVVAIAVLLVAGSAAAAGLFSKGHPATGPGTVTPPVVAPTTSVPSQSADAPKSRVPTTEHSTHKHRTATSRVKSTKKTRSTPTTSTPSSQTPASTPATTVAPQVTPTVTPTVTPKPTPQATPTPTPKPKPTPAPKPKATTPPADSGGGSVSETVTLPLPASGTTSP